MKWGVRRAVNTTTNVSTKKKSGTDKEADGKRKVLSDKQKKAIKIGIRVGAAAAGTALAAYGTYKVSKYVKSEAGRRSYESGKAYAIENFLNKADIRNPAQYDSNINAYRQTLRNTDARTRRVSNSTAEAIKYLRHPERYLVDGDLLRWHGAD